MIRWIILIGLLAVVGVVGYFVVMPALFPPNTQTDFSGGYIIYDRVHNMCIYEGKNGGTAVHGPC